MQLLIEVCANDLYSHLCNWMFISVIYIYMLFYCRQSNSHGLLAAILCVIIGLRTHFWLRTYLPRITHILFSWTVSIVLPNHTQFIPVNRMLYIAHIFIWLPVSFVPPHRKQLIELNRCPSSHMQLKSEPCLMHPTSQTFCTFLTVFLHHRLQLLHRTQFRRRVSDHSVVLAASWSSECFILVLY